MNLLKLMHELFSYLQKCCNYKGDVIGAIGRGDIHKTFVRCYFEEAISKSSGTMGQGKTQSGSNQRK
jgi:hypothetical protein